MYPGLTFSVWFKPHASCITGTTVFDIGNNDGNNIVLGRLLDTSQLQFLVYISSVPSEWKSAENAFVVGEWRHVVWVLTKQDSSALWRIYIDGALAGTLTGAFPANMVKSFHFIGKSNLNGRTSFAGHMDSFAVYPVPFTDYEATLLYTVVYVCMFVCVCVCIICHSGVHGL
jgi:hypothetical protein